MADDDGPPSLAHAALPPFSLAAAATALAPPDAVTQLYYLLPALVFATLLTAWLARGGGWSRLGLRTTPYSLRVFGASWFVVAVLAGVLARPLTDPTGTVVRLVGYGVATTLGTWLAYRGGAVTLQRSVGR
ncbi:hypothetical protein [Halomarina oriensis]|uniref:DUF3054 family protein n=1 Tax=Halomarina oriensis TaxID=671145 RepID=A0A6B0GPP3_9EURY|nr:hypothetical protein [Halomarina oriensis]MWG35529.1 hypothetical protein [Halomarina oriensis]